MEKKSKAEIVKDIFGEDNPRLMEVLKEITGRESPRVMLIADLNVVQHTPGLGVAMGRYFNAHGIVLAGKPVVLTGGEKIKGDDYNCDRKVMKAMIEAKIGQNDVAIVLGGGSILDLGSFAAAQVRGGVHVVRIPTTVASMIDGAYASEAALNSGYVKDAYRIPCVPDAILIDPNFARTVLDGVWRAGFSEAVRLAMMTDAKLMKLLEKSAEAFKNRDFDVWQEVLEACAKTRQKKSPGSFGLWSALRLEAMSTYKLPHGYAVAIGCVIDAKYANLREYLQDSEFDAMKEVLVRCGAMDGALHSRHLVSQTDNIMWGLDAWELGHGNLNLDFPKGVGKGVTEENPERDTMKKALNMIK